MLCTSHKNVAGLCLNPIMLALNKTSKTHLYVCMLCVIGGCACCVLSGWNGGENIKNPVTIYDVMCKNEIWPQTSISLKYFETSHRVFYERIYKPMPLDYEDSDIMWTIPSSAAHLVFVMLRLSGQATGRRNSPWPGVLENWGSVNPWLWEMEGKMTPDGVSPPLPPPVCARP